MKAWFTVSSEHLQSKVKSRIGFLFRNKASFTYAAKHTLVKLNILHILDFCNVIYKIASNTLLSKLDAVYHSAIVVSPKPNIPPTTVTCMLSLAGSRFIFAPVHNPSVNSPSNYLIPILVFIFLLFCTPVFLLAHSSSAHLSLQCFIDKLLLLLHYGLFIALPP